MTIVQITFDSINKASMIGIWVETVLYGINCVMYALCMFTLLRERKVPTLRWVLLAMATILFLLCTAHVTQSLQQLLDVFIYAPVDVLGYSAIYWSNFSLPPRVVKDVLFCTLILAQNIIQIWRLCVVSMENWRIALFPGVLLVASVGSGYAAVVISALPLDAFYGSIMKHLIISACALEITVNIFVTVAIVVRLWWMGRQTASLTATRTNPFTSSIYIIIESGAISAVFSTIFLVFAVPSSPLTLIGFDILAQLDVLLPLLVIVQVSQTERYRSHGPDSVTLRTAFSAPDKITFEPGVPREQDPLQSISLHTMQPCSPTLGPEVQV